MGDAVAAEAPDRAAYVEIEFERSGAGGACVRWVERVTDQVIEEKPDLVVVSNRSQTPAEGHDLEDSAPAYQQGYEHTLGRLVAAGIRVIAIRDTPAGDKSVPDCIAARGDDYRECDGPRARWLPPDPVAAAVAAIDSPLLQLVDLSDRLCGPEVCHVVNGGVITSFDRDHLTATYAHTLAPYLEPAVIAAMSAAASTTP